ncbi:hypothetical protein ACIBG0_40080 [Nocardia sp. NPDC050630]|uniref:hypothetical protein n=1 Tax=Nocardia sp. NPDC050630 TaxID=3364321 RepID=UPI0037BD69BF
MTSWLPLISALVIASVTLVGIRINNRTNRAAIVASDEREYRKWQREMVLRQCGEAIETALHVHDEYWRTLTDRSDKDADEIRATMDEHVAKLGVNVAMLRMLNARTVAKPCDELRDVAVALWESCESAKNGDPSNHVGDLIEDLYRLRHQLAETASAELHTLGRTDGTQEISPIRARFLRARHSGE